MRGLRRVRAESVLARCRFGGSRAHAPQTYRIIYRYCTGSLVLLSQSVSYFTDPPRAHPSTGSQSGSATPGPTQVPSTRSSESAGRPLGGHRAPWVGVVVRVRR